MCSLCSLGGQRGHQPLFFNIRDLCNPCAGAYAFMKQAERPGIKEIKQLAKVTRLQCDLSLLALEVLLHLQLLEHP